jgi:hypothetical protein
MGIETVLNEILKAVLAAAIPILAGYLVTFIQNKSKQAAAGTNSVIVKDLISGAEKIVTDAVTATNQTFVDSLKESGKFDEAAAKAAFEKSKDAILKILPQTTKDALTVLYGDVDTWLTAKIESTVKAQKSEIKFEDVTGEILSTASNDTANATK